MSLQEVEVAISPSGEVQVTTRGFSGSGCTLATAELERLLGNQVLQRELTQEYYATESNAVQDYQHGGTSG